MNNENITKFVAAICVAGLVFLFGKWGAETIFSMGEPKAHAAAEGDGHGEEAGNGQAYTIEVAASGDAGHGEEAGAPAWIAAMAAADPAKGEKGFGKCKACHKLEVGANGTGPSLGAIFERVAGTAEGFKFSQGMIDYGAAGHAWNEENLFTFLGDVKGTVAGTQMSFPGVKGEQDRADLIAFLMADKFDAGKYAGMAEAAAPAAGGDDHAEAPAAEETAMAMPVGDAAKGEKGFGKCKACHKVDAGGKGTGPTMFGVVGRTLGSVEGYKYSKGMEELGAAGQVWDEAHLFKFLGDVKGTVPGTKMSFPGVKDEQDRADIIAYLATLK